MGPSVRTDVIYLSTFSKVLSPGLRLAWVVAPPEVIRKLVQAKQGADLHTAVFNQMIALEVGQHGYLDKHVLKIIEVYRVRRDVMLDALEEHMPKDVTWTRPEGGLFLWVTVPPQINTANLMIEAVQQKVAFVPGESFFPCGGGTNTMRMNFSYSTPEEINAGISRLSRVLRRHI
jgi:2-aminoadipate transaminase